MKAAFAVLWYDRSPKSAFHSICRSIVEASSAEEAIAKAKAELLAEYSMTARDIVVVHVEYEDAEMIHELRVKLHRSRDDHQD